MNKTTLLTLCLVLAAVGSGATQDAKPAKSGHTAAQASHSDDADIQLLRQDIRAERKKIVAANLSLTAAEATKFWPVYDQYVGEMTKVNDTRYSIIKQYEASYSTMTDAQARDLIKHWLSTDNDSTQLRMKYIPEFEKAVPAKKVATFFQIDRRLDLILNLKIASEVPLVTP